MNDLSEAGSIPSEWVEDLSQAPRWVRDVADPDYAEKLRTVREAIEDHPLAPHTYAGKRRDVYRLLSGDMFDRTAREWSRPWLKLRERMKLPLPNSEPSLFAFHDEVYKAMRAAVEDAEEMRRVQAARAQTPSWRQIGKLRDRDRVAELEIERDSLPPDQREAFDRRAIRRFSLPAEDLSWEIRVGDILSRDKLKPGRGRRRALDTPRRILMRLFHGSFTFSPGVAATLTADVLRWFLGRYETPEAIEKAWRRTPGP